MYNNRSKSCKKNEKFYSHKLKIIRKIIALNRNSLNVLFDIKHVWCKCYFFLTRGIQSISNTYLSFMFRSHQVLLP